MLILLDENLAGHTVKNVGDMGWRGLPDRQILELASTYPLDVFITADKNLPFQQNLTSYPICIALLSHSLLERSYSVPFRDS